MRPVKQRALIEHRRAREIVKQKADQIEHRGRLENRGVMPGRNFARSARGRATFRLARCGQRVGIDFR